MKNEGFKNNLEYLEAYFEILLMRTKMFVQNAKEDKSHEDEDLDIPDEFMPKSAPLKEKMICGVDITKAIMKFSERIYATKIILPLEEIARRNSLNDFEKDVLALALATTNDRRFMDVAKKGGLSIARGDALKVREFINILSNDFESRITNRKYFNVDGKLIQNSLIIPQHSRFGQGGSERDFIQTPIELPRRISNAIYGEDNPDDLILSFCEVVKPEIDIDMVVMDEKRKKEVLSLIQKRNHFVEVRKKWGLEQILPYGTGTVILFSGAPGTGKTMFTHSIAKFVGMKLLQVNIPKLLESNDLFDDCFKIVLREAKLQNAMLFFDEADELFQDRSCNHYMPTILREFEKFDGIAILATNRKQILDGALDRRILYKLDFELPKSDMREKIWQEHLPAKMPLEKDVDIKVLADRFEFSGGYIKNAVLLAVQRAISRGESNKMKVTQGDLLWGAQSQRNSQLERFADKIVPSISLENVILPDEHKEVISRIISEYRNSSQVFDKWNFKETIAYGRAITALFHGASGTGKSMTAEALAQELNLNLYPVKIQEIVSCYVGKTAKNISDVFKDAKDAEAVLVFEEADAIFSSRLNEGSHHATYINQEISTLLCELDRFSGIVILTTNLAERIDKAFMRRIRHHLEFPMPDAVARAEIWRKHFPKDAPISKDVDFRRLGKDYEISGGIIRNIVLKAAFEACCDGQVITQEIIERIASDESATDTRRKRVIGFNAVA